MSEPLKVFGFWQTEWCIKHNLGPTVSSQILYGLPEYLMDEARYWHERENRKKVELREIEKVERQEAELAAAAERDYAAQHAKGKRGAALQFYFLKAKSLAATLQATRDGPLWNAKAEIARCEALAKQRETELANLDPNEKPRLDPSDEAVATIKIAEQQVIGSPSQVNGEPGNLGSAFAVLGNPTLGQPPAPSVLDSRWTETPHERREREKK